jgi:hypothetical protein
MAIPLERFAGYLRWRPKPGGKEVKGPDGKVVVDEKGEPQREQEIWIDGNLMMKSGGTGPIVIKPKDCCGILYWSTNKERVFDLLYPTDDPPAPPK